MYRLKFYFTKYCFSTLLSSFKGITKSRQVSCYGYLITCLSAGSLLDAMADAVEQASVVIICLTEKYKESASCRMGIHVLQYFRLPCLLIASRYVLLWRWNHALKINGITTPYIFLKYFQNVSTRRSDVSRSCRCCCSTATTLTAGWESSKAPSYTSTSASRRSLNRHCRVC